LLQNFPQYAMMFSCKHPEYAVAKKLGMPVNELRDLIYSSEIHDLTFICASCDISQVDENLSQKTFLMFSDFGILFFQSIIQSYSSNPERIEAIKNLTTQGKANNPDFLKWDKILSERYKKVWEELAK